MKQDDSIQRYQFIRAFLLGMLDGLVIGMGAFVLILTGYFIRLVIS